MAFTKSGDGGTFRDHATLLARALSDLPQAVTIAGECDHFRVEAVARFRASWLAAHPQGDVVVLRPSGDARTGMAAITAELSGASLFAREKLVIVRQAEQILFPAGGKGERDTEGSDGGGKHRTTPENAFLDRLANPAATIWLVVETLRLPRNRTLGKRLGEHCLVVPCPKPTLRDMPEWLAARARELGTGLDDAAADLLLRAHGPEPGVLAAELEKLALYAGEGKDIDAGMVREFLSGTVELDVFGLTNAVEARDPASALYYARRLSRQGARDQRGKREDGERTAHKVMSMLAGTLQGLMRARVARATGMSRAAFAEAEKISPWRAGKLLDASAAFSARELRLMIRFAASQMRRAHDTGGDAALSLELMAVRFTGEFSAE